MSCSHLRCRMLFIIACWRDTYFWLRERKSLACDCPVCSARWCRYARSREGLHLVMH